MKVFVFYGDIWKKAYHKVLLEIPKFLVKLAETRISYKNNPTRFQQTIYIHRFYKKENKINGWARATLYTYENMPRIMEPFFTGFIFFDKKTADNKAIVIKKLVYLFLISDLLDEEDLMTVSHHIADEIIIKLLYDVDPPNLFVTYL